VEWYNRNLELDGETYSFTHLAPFTINIDIPSEGKNAALNFTLEVKFSTHCVSATTVPHPSKLFLDEGRKERFFCLQRYDLSHALPKIIKDLQNRSCHHARNRNYVTVEISGPGGEKTNYHVFFSVRRQPSSVLVFVESAYIPSSSEKPKGGKIRGKVLLSNTYRRKKIARTR
jgi:hypothetical protein